MAVQIRVNPLHLEQLKNGMPDLGLDTSLRAQRQTGKLLGVHGPYDTKGQLIADGLIRLVEKAVIEYDLTKSELLQFLPDGYVFHYHRAQDHFESCIQCLFRAITYLDQLRSCGYQDSNKKPLVPRARELEVLSDSTKKSVRIFRDYLEHLDRDILNGKLNAASDVGPKLGTTAAEISDATLVYVDVARWCHQVHGIASQLSKIIVTTSEKTLPDVRNS
jgi:hypothetical protein